MFQSFRVPISWRELARRTWREINDDNCLGLAAQLAYYFILALFPALIVVVAIASFFPPSTLQQVLGALAPFTPPDALSLIRTQLDAILASEQAGLLTVGVLGALWSSSAALTAIIDTLNRAYDIDESRPWWKVRLLAIAPDHRAGGLHPHGVHAGGGRPGAGARRWPIGWAWRRRWRRSGRWCSGRSSSRWSPSAWR